MCEEKLCKSATPQRLRFLFPLISIYLKSFGCLIFQPIEPSVAYPQNTTKACSSFMICSAYNKLRPAVNIPDEASTMQLRPDVAHPLLSSKVFT